MVARDRDDDFYGMLGGRIRKLREDRGWTQEELAQAIAIEPATLSRYENAKKTFPLDVLRRIAASLRVPLGQLIADGATRRHDQARRRARLRPAMSTRGTSSCWMSGARFRPAGASSRCGCCVRLASGED